MSLGPLDVLWSHNSISLNNVTLYNWSYDANSTGVKFSESGIEAIISKLFLNLVS